MENETVEVAAEAELSAAVIDYLKRILEVHGAKKNCDYQIENATAKGENYIGVVYRITAEHFSCIVKVPPSNQARREQFFVRPCFLRETMAYQEFLPLVESFQKSKNVVSNELSFHEHPKCYGAITTEMDEAIIMENMNFKGFKLFDRFKELDLKHVSLVMRAYAKLHAVSLAIKDQTPEQLDSFRGITDIFEQRKNDSQLFAYFEHLKTVTLKCIDPVLDEKYYAILKRYFERNSYFDLLLKCLNLADCESFAVVCHGDCWNNNFLYKYDEKCVTDVCIIDWQMMRYGPPISDLMYFLFANTTGDFRRKFYREALDIYYQELIKHLSRLGSDPSKVFPRCAFENLLKTKGTFGLLFSMVVLPVATLKAEDTPDLEKLSEQVAAGDGKDFTEAGFLKNSNITVFEKRMRDVVIDTIDYGYISDL